MKYLFCGLESRARLTLLLELTKISSENTQEALFDHFCRGFGFSQAASINGVTEPNLQRAVNRLNDVAGICERLKEADLNHLTDKSWTNRAITAHALTEGLKNMIEQEQLGLGASTETKRRIERLQAALDALAEKDAQEVV